jgi:beta-ribofuranosylaminobenzene 5'-phosphate synthase
MTLVDLADASFRRYGGVGFTTALCPTIVEAVATRRTSVRNLDRLDAAGRQDVMDLLERIGRIRQLPPHRLTIHQCPPQQVGLGSKTSLLLSTIASLDALFSLGMTRRLMQNLSGRGGTSGTGIHAFFRGGVLFDGGHERVSRSDRFLPSSANPTTKVPPLLCRTSFPDSWRVTILLPTGRSASGRTEKRFFQRVTPIPKDQVLQVLAAIYHGFLPALRLRRIDLASEAIKQINSTGFKAREIARQTAVVRRLLEDLWSAPRIASGMSSLGPVVYAIHEHDDIDARTRIEQAAVRWTVSIIGTARGHNMGAALSE